MTFSAFANMFPFSMRDGRDFSEFVVFLIDNIMKKGSQNPLSEMEKDTLERIYKGKRPISKKNATIILQNLNKQRFAEYLTKHLDEIEGDSFKLKLINNAVSVDINEVDTLTDLFESILEEFANAKKKTNINIEESISKNTLLQMDEQNSISDLNNILKIRDELNELVVQLTRCDFTATFRLSIVYDIDTIQDYFSTTRFYRKETLKKISNFFNKYNSLSMYLEKYTCATNVPMMGRMKRIEAGGEIDCEDFAEFYKVQKEMHKRHSSFLSSIKELISLEDEIVNEMKRNK
ncbi:MAG: hypothetical protein FWB87_04230 [Defluviitaleaceae bacterium]|nr:hypothetical protein [Defluviitaleaceae bacterium]